MDMMECLKKLYAGCHEKICITDKQLKTIWKNSEELPDRFELAAEDKEALEREQKELVCPCVISQRSCCLRIKPVSGDGAEGWLISIFSADDINAMADRSELKRYRIKLNSVITNNLTRILMTLEKSEVKLAKGEQPDLIQLDAEIRKYLLKILAGKANWYELVKYESGDIRRDTIDLSLSMQTLADRFREAAEGQGITFESEIERGIVIINDRERLWAAVSDLLANGVMYNEREDKRLKLRLYQENGEVIISVKDNAGGIDKAVLKSAMTPFSNFEQLTDKESLGISIAAKNCETFGGQLEAVVREGESSEFLMRFPTLPDNKAHKLRMSDVFPLISNYDQTGAIFAKAFELTGRDETIY